MTLKPKILLRVYVLTLLIIVVMSVTYYYLFTRDVRERSHQNVRRTFDVVFDDLTVRVEAVRSKVDLFIQTSLSRPMYMLDIVQRQQMPSEKMSTWQFKKIMTYLGVMTSNMQEFGRLVDASEILVYSSDRTLLAMYQYTNGETLSGVYVPGFDPKVFIPVGPDDRWYAMLNSFEEVPQQPIPATLTISPSSRIPKYWFVSSMRGSNQWRG